MLFSTFCREVSNFQVRWMLLQSGKLRAGFPDPKMVESVSAYDASRMSDDSHPQPSKPSEPAPSPTQNEAPRPPQINSDVQVTPEVVSDRAQLLERARNFLHSPQVRNEDNSAKYRFLAEKGLNEVEIRGLLHELVSR